MSNQIVAVATEFGVGENEVERAVIAALRAGVLHEFPWWRVRDFMRHQRSGVHAALNYGQGVVRCRIAGGDPWVKDGVR